jgi:hypothetical protein
MGVSNLELARSSDIIGQSADLYEAAFIGIRLERKAAESIRHEFKRWFLLELPRKQEQIFLEVRARQMAAEGAEQSNERFLAVVHDKPSFRNTIQ